MWGANDSPLPPKPVPLEDSRGVAASLFIMTTFNNIKNISYIMKTTIFSIIFNPSLPYEIEYGF